MSEKDSSKRIRLTVEGGPTREFPGDRTFVIGRSANADFSIPHPNLSREHVRFSLKDGEVMMEDLGSANGTYVQGQRIPAKSTVKLKPHYRVLLGTGSNVVISFEVVEGDDLASLPEPKGDVDLPSARERTLAAITRNQKVRASEEYEKSLTLTREKSVKMELDFPQQHFPHEVKKEKMAELRILEAKKQRVLEDIQYKEREVDDLRAKIRTMKEESIKLKDQTENFRRELSEQAEALRREIDPLTARRDDLQKCVQELDVIYEEKIDVLESGFVDLKQTLEESHSVRLARADKEFKEKTRRLDEEYANKLSSLETEINSVQVEGERLRDTLVKEKRDLEENLRRVRAESERLEADRKLEQVRIDTETAKLQGDKLKLENEIAAIKHERERVEADTLRLTEQGKAARAVREEARAKVEESKAELASIRQTIADVQKSEAKNLERIEGLKSQIVGLETRADGIQAMIQAAEVEAETIRRRGKEEMEQARRVAQSQMEDERQASRKNAEAQALAQIQAAEVQAFARTQAVETQATTRLEKAIADAHSTLERAQAEGNQYFETKRREADELVAAAEARAAELENGSRNHAERAVTEANNALETRRRELEAEIADVRRRSDQEIRQVRANALADIETAKEREAREFSARLKTRAKAIGDQIDRIVGSKLTAQFGVNMDPVTLKAFSDEVHRIVETVIGPSKGVAATSTAVGENTMSTVMHVDAGAQVRVVQYWKRLGIAASVVFALLLGRVVFPDTYSWFGKKIGMALEVKDNTDAVVKKMLRDRQLAMTFVTEQDQRIRDSYTDNILYTEAFIEMKEDVETQKAWTLGLNKFFQTDLGLTEKAIVQFGSAEGRMIRELIELRKNILPSASASGIAKMRETEAPYVKEMKFVMRTDANWQRYLVYQREFYSRYTETLINRAPASAAAKP